jgi:hypothetical protein
MESGRLTSQSSFATEIIPSTIFSNAGELIFPSLEGILRRDKSILALTSEVLLKCRCLSIHSATTANHQV